VRHQSGALLHAHSAAWTDRRGALDRFSAPARIDAALRSRQAPPRPARFLLEALMAAPRSPAALKRREEPAGTALAAEWVPLSSLYTAEFGSWRDLAARALDPNVFLEPAFARAAASFLFHGKIGAVVVRSGERLLGLMPGRIEGLSSGRPVATFVA